MTSGIFLSREDLILLSDSAKEEVLALATGESVSGVYEESEDGPTDLSSLQALSLIHISEPTRLGMISYAVFCLKKKKNSKGRIALVK